MKKLPKELVFGSRFKLGNNPYQVREFSCLNWATVGT